MEKKREVVKVTYEFEIRYAREEHKKMMLRDLRRNPEHDMSGAGMVGGEAYSYGCKKLKKLGAIDS